MTDGGGQENDCTSGFMSLNRIHTLLDSTTLRVLKSSQVIIPGINFTCNGNIHKWIFGAEWYGNTESYTELQIWRSSGDGSYTKVGSTTIIADNNPTELYEYPLFAPVSFQEGDILGYYQPSESRSQLGLQLEQEYGHRLYIDSKNSSTSDLSLEEFGGYSHEYQVLISVETFPPGCGHGFMSVERMRILLGLDSVGNEVTNNGRQQITPDMKFTCDGIITKWIIGAEWSQESDDTLYPELQLWREIGNDTYQKINGTLITIETQSDDCVYEYDNFPPIPFQAGDILGVFIPPVNDSRLTFKSEKERGLTNYYILTGYNVTTSPYKTINLHQNTPPVQSSVYHPLVTVEIRCEFIYIYPCTLNEMSNISCMEWYVQSDIHTSLYIFIFHAMHLECI